MPDQKAPTMGVRVPDDLRALVTEAARAETMRTGEHVTPADIIRRGMEREARRALRKGER